MTLELITTVIVALLTIYTSYDIVSKKNKREDDNRKDQKIEQLSNRIVELEKIILSRDQIDKIINDRIAPVEGNVTETKEIVQKIFNIVQKLTIDLEVEKRTKENKG